MTAEPAFIEFAGLPGSGKTTLALGVTKRLSADGHNVNLITDAGRLTAERTILGRMLGLMTASRLRRLLLWWLYYAMGLLHSARLAWTNRVTVMWLVGFQLRRPIRTGLKTHIIWWYMQLVGRRSVLESHCIPGEIVVYDDGLVHRAIALFASPVDEDVDEASARYLGSIPMPAALVHVNATILTCERRVIERGLWKHSRQWTSRDLKRYLENGAWVLSRAIRCAQVRGVVVIEVDNDSNDLDTVIRAITRNLEPLIAKRSEVGDL